jgi:hypothetical protein
MLGKISEHLQGVVDSSSRMALSNILRPLGDRHACRMLNSAALAGTAVTVPSTGAVSYLLVANVLRTIGSSQALAALAGTVVNATFNVFLYLVNASGTLSTKIGLPGATLAAVRFPEIPEGLTVIGFTIINPTGTGDFVGGTTNFNDATVVPNAVHISIVGEFDPSIKV